jgi:hypothetical protein
MMLAQLDSHGAKYPAEHNVGHLYKAEKPWSILIKDLLIPIFLIRMWEKCKSISVIVIVIVIVVVVCESTL